MSQTGKLRPREVKACPAGSCRWSQDSAALKASAPWCPVPPPPPRRPQPPARDQQTFLVKDQISSALQVAWFRPPLLSSVCRTDAAVGVQRPAGAGDGRVPGTLPVDPETPALCNRHVSWDIPLVAFSHLKAHKASVVCRPAGPRGCRLRMRKR